EIETLISRSLSVRDLEAHHGLAAAPPKRPARAGSVDEDATDRLRRRAEEIRPVLPTRGRVTDQAQVGLVHESRGLQRLAGLLRGEQAIGESPQFGVDELEELVR